jgi:hypothetical protein
MRRSAALLPLLLLLAAGPPPASASVSAPRAPVVIGIFNDPATLVALALWSVRGVAWLMEISDDLIEHVREDVRRAQHPQRTVPRVLPLRSPRPIPLFPVLPPGRSAQPLPIVDTLPLEAAS